MLKLPLLATAAIAALMAFAQPSIAADDIKEVVGVGKINWKTNNPEKVNVRVIPPLTDIRVTTTVTLYAGASYAVVQYEIGTGSGTSFTRSAFFERQATSGDVTNDFKDMQNGTTYRVKVFVSFYRVGAGGVHVRVGQEDYGEGRTITP